MLIRLLKSIYSRCIAFIKADIARQRIPYPLTGEDLQDMKTEVDLSCQAKKPLPVEDSL
jgi:hypothetical protein